MKSSFRTLAAAALLASVAAHPLRAETASTAPADSKAASKPAAEEKPASDKKTFSKAEIEAFLTKCSVEADEKGLTKAKNKLAERKAFRRTCMSKFGVEPKSAKSE